MSARRNQLNYRQASAKDLPIGSGEIKSAHRYIAQQRLKLPGAWWHTDHADYKLARRITRKDGDGPAYWAALSRNGPTAALWSTPSMAQPT